MGLPARHCSKANTHSNIVIYIFLMCQQKYQDSEHRQPRDQRCQLLTFSRTGFWASRPTGRPGADTNSAAAAREPTVTRSYRLLGVSCVGDTRLDSTSAQRSRATNRQTLSCNHLTTEENRVCQFIITHDHHLLHDLIKNTSSHNNKVPGWTSLWKLYIGRDIAL